MCVWFPCFTLDLLDILFLTTVYVLLLALDSHSILCTYVYMYCMYVCTYMYNVYSGTSE